MEHGKTLFYNLKLKMCIIPADMNEHKETKKPKQENVSYESVTPARPLAS
jgi:hypothetical protein